MKIRVVKAEDFFDLKEDELLMLVIKEKLREKFDIDLDFKPSIEETPSPFFNFRSEEPYKELSGLQRGISQVQEELLKTSQKSFVKLLDIEKESLREKYPKEYKRLRKSLIILRDKKQKNIFYVKDNNELKMKITIKNEN